MSIFEKMKVKIILIQWLGLFFLINGIQRIYNATRSEQIMLLLQPNPKSEVTIIADFLIWKTYWTLGALVLGIVIITLINRRNKIHFSNTLLVIAMQLIVSQTGIYSKGIIVKYFNSFGRLFINDYLYSYIIGGVTFTLIAVLLFWKSGKLNK